MISKACDWLDASLPQMESDLIALCDQNSGSANVEGLLQVADWIEKWIGFSNVKFERTTLPSRKVVTDLGARETVETGPLLRWDQNPTADRRILLCIHYDTVFGTDNAFQTCRHEDADKINGPGVADAKGGIVVLTYALRALQKFELDREIGWSVILNPDEELGSPHSTSYLHAAAPDFDFGLLFEPSLPSGELVSDRKGSGNFDIVVRGKSAHAGRHFDDGRNAVAELSRLLVALDQLNGEKDGATINVGFSRGGGPVNIVPDLAVGRLNVRVQDQTSADWFQGKLAELIAEADAKDGFEVKHFGGMTSPPKQLNEKQKSLMAALEAVVHDLEDRNLRWRSTGGVCDGNKLAAAGLPNVDTLGPTGDGLHSSREWVQVSSISQKAKIITTLIHRYSLGDFPDLDRGSN